MHSLLTFWNDSNSIYQYVKYLTKLSIILAAYELYRVQNNSRVVEISIKFICIIDNIITLLH